MIHEVPDKQRLFGEIKDALKQDGKLLLAGLLLHVTGKSFKATVSSALSAGFQIMEKPPVPVSTAVLLKNTAP